MKVEIEAPDEFAGALMGDLNGRRGRVQGMESKGRTTVINAEVPMAEMLTYGTILTSMTQGKGSYRMEMNHYDIVPQRWWPTRFWPTPSGRWKKTRIRR
jgi:elongation factor G